MVIKQQQKNLVMMKVFELEDINIVYIQKMCRYKSIYLLRIKNLLYYNSTKKKTEKNNLSLIVNIPLHSLRAGTPCLRDLVRQTVIKWLERKQCKNCQRTDF